MMTTSIPSSLTREEHDHHHRSVVREEPHLEAHTVARYGGPLHARVLP